MIGQQYVENVILRHNFWVDIYIERRISGQVAGDTLARLPQVRGVKWARPQGTDDFSKALKASREGASSVEVP